MNIAILTSGGDSAGMNPAIKRFIEYSFELGLTPYLVYNGLEGLIDNEIKKATSKDASGIINRGGTVLKSSRSKRFFEKKYRKKAYENLKKLKIEKLVVVGGDGSFRALNAFYNDFKMPFVGIPGTIDNDIHGSEYSLGTDTALNIIRSAIDDVRDTASSFRRGFVIETMGRDCGYLALVSALTSGAEICLIPELKADMKSIKKRLKKEFAEDREYLIAIVAEGTHEALNLTKWIEKEFGVESRLTTLGHIQRGGTPSTFDRLMAYEFVTYGIDALLKGESGKIVVYRNAKVDLRSVAYVTKGKHKLQPELLKQAKKLMS
ncbi:MAG: 6-phosphofructokinase [Campylobacterales bacterium]|nr:6-phosphofructokinase [Campylobacterales bacterium]